MKIPFRIIQQFYTLHRISQNEAKRGCLSLSLMAYSRVFHCGILLTEENISGKITPLLSNNINMYGILKRNATKKAKGKKKAGGGSGGGSKVDLSVGSDIINLKAIQGEMISVTKRLADEFKQRYAPKLTANILDNIPLKIDGSTSPLYEVAEVMSYEKEFLIAPSSPRDGQIILEAIKKTLNVDTMLVKSQIRIPVSIASSEYKENILKLAKASAEKCKVDIRKIRQQGITIAKKEGGSKDAIRSIETQIQLMTDRYCQEVESMVSKKELELKPGGK